MVLAMSHLFLITLTILLIYCLHRRANYAALCRRQAEALWLAQWEISRLETQARLAYSRVDELERRCTRLAEMVRKNEGPPAWVRLSEN